MILVFHFLFVGIFKWFFERARHSKNGLHISIVTFINIFACSIVYVRIVPIEKPLGIVFTSTFCNCQLPLFSTSCWPLRQPADRAHNLPQPVSLLPAGAHRGTKRYCPLQSPSQNVLLGLVPLVLHDGSQCCVSFRQMAAVFTGPHRRRGRGDTVSYFRNTLALSPQLGLSHPLLQVITCHLSPDT